jgi:hypothetical protein
VAELYGADYVYQTLSTDAGVLAILGGEYVYCSRMVPKDVTARKTINAYSTLPCNPRSEYFESRWSIDCRADTQEESIDIATAVVDALNRKGKTVNGKNYFGVNEMVGTIPPVNDSDQYNTPVQVYIRRR